MKKNTILLTVAALFFTIILKASDTLVVYNMPNKILVDYGLKQGLGKITSLESQKLIEVNVKSIIPANISYRVVNDTSYFSPINQEIETLMSQFRSKYRVEEIKVPKSILSWSKSMNTSKVIFLNTSGVMKEKREVIQIVAEYMIGGLFLSSRKKPNLSIQTLVLDVKTERFVYYELAGKYGKPLNFKVSQKVLEWSLEDYFTKGINILFPRK